MQHGKPKRSLESYKIFPYVAWGLIGGFAFFVYNLVTELEDTAAQLQQQTAELHTKVHADPKTADFESLGTNRLGTNETE